MMVRALVLILHFNLNKFFMLKNSISFLYRIISMYVLW